MTFELRLVVVVLASFAMASLAGASLVSRLHRRANQLDGRARADALLSARLLPLRLALAASALALGSWLLFEQRGLEPIGLVLPALAVLAAACLTTGLVRVLWRAALTRRTVASWLRRAEPCAVPGVAIPTVVVDTPFPVVAVVGLWRPRLMLARSVRDGCPADELRAVLAHEQHHIDRRDNLKRMLLSAAPDILAWLPLSRRVLADWREATEDAADDAAGRPGAGGRALLAQALIRVARLAPAGGWTGPLPASALYRGEGLDRRVRRLLDSQDGPTSRRAWPTHAIALLGLAALSGLDRVHGILEIAVTYLP